MERVIPEGTYKGTIVEDRESEISLARLIGVRLDMDTNDRVVHKYYRSCLTAYGETMTPAEEFYRQFGITDPCDHRSIVGTQVEVHIKLIRQTSEGYDMLFNKIESIQPRSDDAEENRTGSE